MIEHSHKQEEWFAVGQIIRTSAGWIIKDLLVRWNERQQTIEGPDGEYQEYVYDAYYFDMPLPVEVEPGTESVEYYLEQAKSAIITYAQNLAIQGEGFDVD